MSFIPASLLTAGGVSAKPSGVVYLNRAHPMARHMEMCLLPMRGGWIDLVSRRFQAVSGTGELLPKSDGEGMASSAVGADISFPTTVGSDPDYSVGIVTWPDATTANIEIFKLQESSGTALALRIRGGLDLMEFRYFLDGAARTIDNSSVSRDVNNGVNRFVLCFTSYAADDHVMDDGGDECGASSATYGYAASDVVEMLVRGMSNNTGPSQLCIIWNKALTPDQRRAWGRQPYAPYGIPLFVGGGVGFALEAGGGGPPAFVPKITFF